MYVMETSGQTCILDSRDSFSEGNATTSTSSEATVTGYSATTWSCLFVHMVNDIIEELMDVDMEPDEHRQRRRRGNAEGEGKVGICRS